jgi:predicted enzyme related to lactoylglutathione lyase
LAVPVSPVTLATVRLFSGDVRRSAQWYQALFGIDPAEDLGDFVSFQIGAVRLEITLADDKSPSSAGGSVGYWLVEDLDRVIIEAVALGGAVYRGPLRVAEVRRTIVQIKDPCGNVIGFEAAWDGGFLVRDLHCFDQSAVSADHDTALTKSSLICGTLPVMDTARWSKDMHPGMRPIRLGADGLGSPMVPDGPPVVEEAGSTGLKISQKMQGGGTFSAFCREPEIAFDCVDGQGKPIRWAWDLTGGADQKAVVQSVSPRAISYRCDGVAYQLRPLLGVCEQLADGTIRITAGASGKLFLRLVGT